MTIKITWLGSMGVKVRENLRFIEKIVVGGMVMRVDGGGVKLVLRILLLRMLARVVVEMVVTKGVNKVVKTEVGKNGDKLRTDTIPETIFD